MSVLQNSVVQNIVKDLAVQTGVDSLRKKQVHLGGVPTNAVALSAHHLVVKRMAEGKLSGLLDATSSAMVEDYVSRFGSLYLSKMLMGSQDGDKEVGTKLGKLAKKQLYYSFALYLFNAGYGQLNKPLTSEPQTRGATIRA